MEKYLIIIQRLIDFLKYIWNFLKKMFNYLFSISIELTSFAKILILIGSAILVMGVLTRSTIDVINNSIIGNNEPGMIISIYFPDNIISFIRERNRIILGLVIICLGFYFELFSEKDKKYIVYKLCLISLVILYVISSLIAGYIRNNTIKSWQNENCRYQWLVNNLFSKIYLYDTFAEFSKTNQGQESLMNIMTHMEFVSDALGIEIKFKVKSYDKLSLKEIEDFQDEMRKEIENTSFFYYFFKPKKLLNAFW